MSGGLVYSKVSICYDCEASMPLWYCFSILRRQEQVRVVMDKPIKNVDVIEEAHSNTLMRSHKIHSWADRRILCLVDFWWPLTGGMVYEAKITSRKVTIFCLLSSFFEMGSTPFGMLYITVVELGTRGVLLLYPLLFPALCSFLLKVLTVYKLEPLVYYYWCDPLNNMWSIPPLLQKRYIFKSTVTQKLKDTEWQKKGYKW